jgi:amino acid transporter
MKTLTFLAQLGAILCAAWLIMLAVVLDVFTEVKILGPMIGYLVLLLVYLRLRRRRDKEKLANAIKKIKHGQILLGIAVDNQTQIVMALLGQSAEMRLLIHKLGVENFRQIQVDYEAFIREGGDKNTLPITFVEFVESLPPIPTQRTAVNFD